ncbi:MAG: glycerol kinase GlpK [Fimbriimonas sp.]
MSRVIVALDQGTTSSRAFAFDEDGRIVASSQTELPQSYPHPAWVEHDPERLWADQMGVAADVVARVGAENVEAIGITNQRETTLLWDRTTGEAIYPAIVWQDRRTAALCDRLRLDGVDEMIARRTGLVVDSYFSATKLAWLLAHVPGARARAQRGELAFGTVDSFLVWKLTAGARHVTDVSNASRTMMFNIHSRKWDEELLRLFDIPREVLPEVIPSSGFVGETTAFGGSIPICGIAGDQQAALFGQRCISKGMAKSTYGTGCFLLMNVGEKAQGSNNQLLSTVAWQLGVEKPEYALEGSVFVAGAAVQWLRDEMGLLTSAQESEAIANSVSSTEGVYLVPAFTGLGAPYWNPHARGMLVGLTRGSGRAHVVRATLESIAYQCRDVLEAMTGDCETPLKEVRVDGGAASNDFLMQFQADILGTTVVRPKITETTALGAAYLAGLGCGFWTSQQLEGQWEVDRRFEPQMSTSERETLYDGWKMAVNRSL